MRLLAILLLTIPLSAQTGENVLLVANRSSALSKQIADYYRPLRAVPAENAVSYTHLHFIPRDDPASARRSGGGEGAVRALRRPAALRKLPDRKSQGTNRRRCGHSELPVGHAEWRHHAPVECHRSLPKEESRLASDPLALLYDCGDSAIMRPRYLFLIVSDPLLHSNNWVLSPNNSGVRLSAAIRNSE